MQFGKLYTLCMPQQKVPSFDNYGQRVFLNPAVVALVYENPEGCQSQTECLFIFSYVHVLLKQPYKPTTNESSLLNF